MRIVQADQPDRAVRELPGQPGPGLRHCWRRLTDLSFCSELLTEALTA